MAGNRDGSTAMAWARVTVVLLLLALAIVVIVKRMPGPALQVVSGDDLRTHYLIDFDYGVDAEAGEATMGHLVVLNPGGVDAVLEVTVYFQDREPQTFELTAPAQSSTESNYAYWPVREGERFALEIEASVPVFCQATIGWNNTSNDYSAEVVTRSAREPREAAKSYTSLRALADRWYLPDGYIIDKPGQTWVREAEWAILLNPHPEDLELTLTLFAHGEAENHRVEVPARRVRWLDMSTLAPPNRHYGARFTGPMPFAAQWQRTVHGADAPELMTYWSVPLVPLSGEGDPPGADAPASGGR